MKLSTALFACGLAATACAQTSPDFAYQVSQNLRVVYNDSYTEVSPPGILIPRANVLTAPTAYLPSNVPANGSYVLFLIDIDVPRNGSKVNLLHWFQPNLVGEPSVLVRDNTTVGASTAVGAAYIPPTPPGGSGPHRYNFLLFAQPAGWSVPSSYLSINPPANSSARVGFNITAFVAASGLGEPIAGNYLQVLNGTAAETSSALTMTLAAATSTSSSGSEATGSLASSVIASASSTISPALSTGGAEIVHHNGKEMAAGIAMALVGAAAWML